MKPTFLTALITTGLALAWSAAPSHAQLVTYTTATSGTYAGDVINSTYTFSNLPAGTTSFNAVLEQTQIPQNTLNNIAPPASFELQLTSLDYEDTQNMFVGTGAPLEINLSFYVQPTIQQGSATMATLTLISTESYTGDVQASGQDPIDFVLASPPVSFPVSIAQNLGNLASVQPGQPLSTWTDSVTNIHSSSQATSNVGGQTYHYNLNGTFSNLSGSLVVTYAVPEPSSLYLGGIGFALILVTALRRRFRLKSQIHL